jgi:hypothetical protein
VPVFSAGKRSTIGNAMKHKNLLLVALFTALFVFQQAQASTDIAALDSSSQPDLLQSYNPPSMIYVRMYRLDDRGFQVQPPQECSSGDNTYGCTQLADSNYYYPYDTSPALVDVENDYLLDVIAHEMYPGDYPNAAALSAQAVAARSFAYYWHSQGWNLSNCANCTNGQVFVPYAFEFFLGDSDLQNKVSTAVSSTGGYYMTSDGMPINAQFSSDWGNMTSDEGSKPYLKGVADPISNVCAVSFNGNGWGMNQRGANRWALGNQCAKPTEGNMPWPVKWDDYRQILVHYYTGIDILDANGNKVAPDDRWNLLWHDTPTQMNAGQSYNINLKLQNTSTWSWTGNVVLGWQWTQTGALPNPQGWQGNTPLAAVQGATIDNTVSIIAPATDGTYTLHLDLGRPGGSWFSNGWPHAEIPVAITGSVATPTPTPPVIYSISIQINQGSDDAGIHPATCAFTTTENVYFGECANGMDITSGFRFNNVQIPQNAIIRLAYINFTVDGPYDDELNIDIFGEANGNPVTFSASNTPGNRPKTLSSVLWHIRADEHWTLGEHWLTPDFASVIQEIVSRADWSPGNSMVIITTKGGLSSGPWKHRRVIPFERAGSYGLEAATQVITYELGPTPTPGTPPGPTTPVHTPTPTPLPTTAVPPTATPKPWYCFCDLFCDSTLLMASQAQGYGTITPMPSDSPYRNTVQQVVQVSELTTLLYRVRDEILSQSPEGQRLTTLYYTYAPDIAELLLADENLFDQGGSVLMSFAPGLQAMLDGEGDTVTITEKQVLDAQAFLDELIERGDPDLQAVIRAELERHPLDAMIGMTMDDAWAYTNGYKLTWRPPLNTANPYVFQIGRTIPVEFTLVDSQGNFVVDESVTLQLLDNAGNIVVGPVGLGSNPANGIVIQGKKYHYNLQTKDLSAGIYTLQVFYNAVASNEPAIWTIQLKAK